MKREPITIDIDDGITLSLADVEALKRWERLTDNGTDPVKACLMANRGMDRERRFRTIPDPEEIFPNVGEIAAIVEKWVTEEPERTVIHGDYDCDGITGMALLSGFFRQAYGTEIALHSNFRKDGYSMTPEIVENLYARGFRNVLTVDKGIADVDGVKRAKELDMNVVIIDHHLPKKELPKADGILCWTLYGDDWPHKPCGAASAFFLAKKLNPKIGSRFVDMAGMATIVDMVPLDSEVNVVLSSKALERMKKGIYSTGAFEKMVEYLSPSSIDYKFFGYSLGPLINTAGRNDLGSVMADMLKEDDLDAEFFFRVKSLNDERKNVIYDTSVDIEEHLVYSNDHVLVAVIDGIEEENPEKYAGLVATSISGSKESLGKAVFVMYETGGYLKGSARSGNTDFDLQKIFGKEYDGVGIVGGGHRKACGFSFPAKNLERFIEKIAAEKIRKKEIFPEIRLAEPERLDDSLVGKIKSLEPFGPGNEAPRVLLRDEGRKKKITTISSKHNKIVYEDLNLEIMLFNVKDAAKNAKDIRAEFRKGCVLFAEGTVDFNDFGGRRKITMIADTLAAVPKPEINKKISEKKKEQKKSSMPNFF